MLKLVLEGLDFELLVDFFGAGWEVFGFEEVFGGGGEAFELGGIGASGY